MARKEFLNCIKKNFPDYMDSKEPQKDIEMLLNKANQLGDNVEELFKEGLGETPVFEFDLAANDAE